MKVMRFLDNTGDTAIEFDETEATATARVEAEALLQRAFGKGAVAFSVTEGGGKLPVKITDFDQAGAETIVVPRIVGG